MSPTLPQLTGPAAATLGALDPYWTSYAGALKRQRTVGEGGGPSSTPRLKPPAEPGA